MYAYVKQREDKSIESAILFEEKPASTPDYYPTEVDIDEETFERINKYGLTSIYVENGKAVWKPTDEEYAQHVYELKKKEALDNIVYIKESVDDMQYGIIEVAGMAAENELSVADVQDALVELAEIVTGLIGE